MKLNSDVLLLRALKGAPLSVLLAVRYLGRAGTSELAAATGYSREAVGLALQALASMGLVVNRGRYNGWQLTPMGVQLPLFTPSQLDNASAQRDVGKTDIDVGKTDIPLLGSSSSSLVNSKTESVNLTTTTTVRDVGKTDIERGNSDIPVELAEDASRLAEIMVTRFTARRPAARGAVEAALLRGEAPAYIEQQLLVWDNWLGEARNRQAIKFPGAFVARKLADGEPPPAGVAIGWADQGRVLALRAALSADGDEVDGSDGSDEADGSDGSDEADEADEADGEPAARELWETVKLALRPQLPRGTYDAWVRETVGWAQTAEGLVVAAPSARAVDWLAQRLRGHCERALAGIDGETVRVIFTTQGAEV